MEGGPFLMPSLADLLRGQQDEYAKERPFLAKIFNSSANLLCVWNRFRAVPWNRQEILLISHPLSSASEKIRFLKDIDKIRLHSPGQITPIGVNCESSGERIYISIHIYVQWTNSQWLRHCKTWSHLLFIFFIMCRFFRSKIHIVNVLFIYIRKSKEKNYTYEKFMFCFKVKHLSLY